MSQVKISGNASGTGILTVAAPNTNTDYTLTLPAETGTVLTSASNVVQKGVTAFSAYKTSNQSYSQNTWTKITFQAEAFDTASSFDLANARFQPTVAGYYQMNCSAYMNQTASDIYTQLYKNGSAMGLGGVYSNLNISGINNAHLAFSYIVYLNGSTDYLEFWAYSGAASPVVPSGGTWFQGILVRAA